MSSPSKPPPRGAAAAWRRPALSARLALAGLAGLLLVAAAWRIWRASGQRLWLDELYTVTLIDTPSLWHVWEGAIRGVDGNPPLYLTLCWLLARATGGDAEWLLEPLNLVFLSATAVLLYRIGRRLADPPSVAAGLLVLCAADGMVVYALLEIRTYALYLLLVTATLAATLRVVDRPAPGRVAALAGVAVLATLAHSFGGFYVLAIAGGAGLVCLSNRDRVASLALAAGALPAGLVLALWVRASLAAQLAVASPYGWIPVPDVELLVTALTGAPLPTLLLSAGLVTAGLRAVAAQGGPLGRRLAALCRHRPDLASLTAALAGFTALTVAGWVGSHVVTPFFVPRYFIPNLILPGLLAGPALAAVRRRVDPRLYAIVVAVCVAAGLTAVAADVDDGRRAIPCEDEAGRFLEEGLVPDGTPVVAESPQAWLPRARYAPLQTTLFPLDWQVVLRHPTAARSNAMDFHIMDILRDWAVPDSAMATRILPTAAILDRHRRMLVLNQDTRSWLTELRSTRPVSARLLRQSAGCKLWDVTLPETAPGHARP